MARGPISIAPSRPGECSTRGLDHPIEAGGMFDPGIGVVGITATDGSISSRLLGQPSHRSHLTQGTIWSSILRRTTAALSNIPPRPDGALGVAGRRPGRCSGTDHISMPDVLCPPNDPGAQSKRVGDEAGPPGRAAGGSRRIDDPVLLLGPIPTIRWLLDKP